MDAKFLVAFLFAAIVAVYSKPIEDGVTEVKDDDSIVLSHDQVEHIQKSIGDLTKRVAMLTEQITKKDTAETHVKGVQEDFHSLEESLKRAVAEDKAQQDAMANVPSPSKDAEAPKSSFFNSDADFLDYDFDEYGKQMEKTQMKALEDELSGVRAEVASIEAKRQDAAKSGPHLDQPAADVEIVRPKIVDPVDGIANDEENDAKDTSDVAGLHGVVKQLKRELKDVAANYKAMAAKFDEIKNDAPMDDVTTDKYNDVKTGIKELVDSIKQIKDEFGFADDVQDEIPAEEVDTAAAKDLLEDVQSKAKDLKLDIMELIDEAHRMEDEMNAKKAAQLESKEKDEGEMDDGKTQMEALEKELSGVRADVASIKDRIQAVSDASLKKKIIKNESDRLEDLMSELNLIKEEVHDIAEKKDAQPAKP